MSNGMLLAVAAMVAVFPVGPAMAQGRAQGRGQPQTAQLSPDKAADRQVWIDEHARWNSEHMAAARRLDEVAAALRQHSTGFDLHGKELRAYGSGNMSSEQVIQVHPRLRTAHEQARNVHDDLMDAVYTLTRVLRKDLGKNQSFPAAPERP